METFFQNDSRIKSWLEQVIEKIFTVCLLKGTESELAVEFTKGRQLVVKITMLLTDISSLPPTAVVDAIHQLLEQRLPDQRIIDNFPNFYQVMEDMIREGIAIVSEIHNPSLELNNKSLDLKDKQKQNMLQKPSSVIILAGGREPMLTPRSSGSYMTIHSNQDNPTSTIRNLTENKSENPDLCNPDLFDVPVLAAVADLTDLTFGKYLQQKPIFVDTNLDEIDDTIANSDHEYTGYFEDLDKSKTILTYEEAIPDTISSPKDQEIQVTNSLMTTKERLIISTDELKPTDIELQPNPSKDLPISKNRVRSSSQIPTEATRLALVLQQFFPNAQARWNFNLGQDSFLVQINDLLIYLDTQSEGDRVEKQMKKEGWKIIVCNNEDLCFPRRLERAIHRVLKDSKKKL